MHGSRLGRRWRAVLPRVLHTPRTARSHTVHEWITGASPRAMTTHATELVHAQDSGTSHTADTLTRDYELDAAATAAAEEEAAAINDTTALPPAPHPLTQCRSTDLLARVLQDTSSYTEAAQALALVRDRGNERTTERHHLAVMEKANVERRYGVMASHFDAFLSDLEAERVARHRTPRATWDHYTPERMQMHRLVLWAMLHGSPTTRFRYMQRFYRAHVLHVHNQVNLYENDALNFLLRMESTFKLTAASRPSNSSITSMTSARDGSGLTWLARIERILTEMRAMRFTTSTSSAHALFHFLMHHPEVAATATATKVAHLLHRPTSSTSASAEDEAAGGGAGASHTDSTQNKTMTGVDTQDSAQQEEEDEEGMIAALLFLLMDRYEQPLGRNPLRVSLAITTAASAGRLHVAMALLRDAQACSVPVDAAAFAHVVANTSHDDKRMELAEMYLHAQESGCLYDSAHHEARDHSGASTRVSSSREESEEDREDSLTANDTNTGTSNSYVLRYAIHDGNFAQMMELLHEMESANDAATPLTVNALFGSIANYRAASRRDLRYVNTNANANETSKSSSTIRARKPHRGWLAPPVEVSDAAARLEACPTVRQLMDSFPRVLPRRTHTLSRAVLESLRAGDLLDALVLLRTTVWSTHNVTLRPEIYSQVLYAQLASLTAAQHHHQHEYQHQHQRQSQQASPSFLSDAVAEIIETEKLFDVQHRGQRPHLLAQLLNLCASSDDLLTALTVLDRAQAHAEAIAPAQQTSQASPLLSLRARDRVFNIISAQLKALIPRSASGQASGGSERYFVQGRELSFRAVMEEYPALFPATAATVGRALVRSATTGLQHDVAPLLGLALDRGLELEPAAYKVAIHDLARELTRLSQQDADDFPQQEREDTKATLRRCVVQMQATGVWATVVKRYPDLPSVETLTALTEPLDIAV